MSSCSAEDGPLNSSGVGLKSRKCFLLRTSLSEVPPPSLSYPLKGSRKRSRLPESSESSQIQRMQRRRYPDQKRRKHQPRTLSRRGRERAERVGFGIAKASRGVGSRRIYLATILLSLSRTESDSLLELGDRLAESQSVEGREAVLGAASPQVSVFHERREHKMGRELNERLFDLRQLCDVPRGACSHFRMVLEGVSRCQSGAQHDDVSCDRGRVKTTLEELIPQAFDVVVGF